MGVSTSTAPVSLSNVWKFVEEHIVTAASEASFDFSTAVNGDTDQEYLIVGKINGASSNSAQVRANGALIQGFYQFCQFKAAVINQSQGNGVFVGDFTLNCTAQFCARFVGMKANATYERTMYSESLRHDGASPDAVIQNWANIITTPAKNTTITSLGCQTNAGAGFATGSYFALYKRVTV